MTQYQDKNYYVIVGRDGTGPVARWSPAQIDVATARDGVRCHGRTQPEETAVVEMGGNELIDDTPTT